LGNIGGVLISTESVGPRLDKLMMSKYLPVVGPGNYEIDGNCLIDRNAGDWETRFGVRLTLLGGFLITRLGF